MASAQGLLRLARQHVGEQYVLGAMVPKDNADWRGPWDCAEFASWCVFQVAGTLFGCRPRTDPDTADAYSGFWMEDVAKLGTKISIAQAAATAGAFLLRAPAPNAVGHVVICAGNGKTVEAHSTKRGVIENVTEGRRWDSGVLVPGITTSVPPAPPPQPRPSLVLRVKDPPMKGELVRRVQRRLTKLGFHPGPPDGEFGPQTAAAVQAFQMSKGLLPDAEVGQRTAKALGVEWI
jgi:cell wall-associated NlpC family hydrolase